MNIENQKLVDQLVQLAASSQVKLHFHGAQTSVTPLLRTSQIYEPTEEQQIVPFWKSQRIQELTPPDVSFILPPAKGGLA